MQEILFYMLKMTGCSGILMLYYVLFLRNKEFHQYNRFYLLAAVIVSLIFPLINISILWEGASSGTPLYMRTLEVMTLANTVKNVPAGNLPVQWIVLAVYFLISVVLLILMINAVRRIAEIRRKYQPEEFVGFNFYNTAERNTPFSFFRNIFWNRQLDLHSEKGQKVFNHELYHVKQWHSADLMFMQIILSVVWINPFFYIMKRELSTIHEYLADQFAVSGNDRYEYAEFLIANAIKQRQQASIVHYFFQPPLKRRIAMILKYSSKTRLSYTARIMSFPLIIVLFCTLALKAEISLNNTITPLNGQALFTTVYSPSVFKPGPAHRDATFIQLQEEAEFKGGQEGYKKFLMQNFSYPEQAQKLKKEGTAIIAFIVDENGNVESPSILKDPGAGMGEEALRLIKLSSGRWVPGMQNGHAVRSYKKMPFTFKLNK